MIFDELDKQVHDKATFVRARLIDAVKSVSEALFDAEVCDTIGYEARLAGYVIPQQHHVETAAGYLKEAVDGLLEYEQALREAVIERKRQRADRERLR